MTKMTDLKKQSENDLLVLLKTTSMDIFKLQSELKVNRKLDKPHELKSLKKKRARILTLVNQKSKES